MLPPDREVRHTIDVIPAEADLERFAVPYTPETFNDEERRYLEPFVTNLDQPVFVLKNLPPEVAAALPARYSRAKQGLRRILLKEYIGVILHPEEDKDWKKMTDAEKQEALETRDDLNKWIDDYHERGGMERVVNTKRARKFFKRWLLEYGDDSIAELGGVTVCLEGLSMVATKEIEGLRVGMSPLEKSTRYVQYWDKRPDGQYQYVVPGEIRGTRHEGTFKEAMDNLFTVYERIADLYLPYIKDLLPQIEGEDDKSFEASRKAKVFDDIRDLLPFATQTNMGLFANGRALEGLMNRMLDNSIGEVRWWGQGMLRELSKVVPSFMDRSKTERGAEVQLYRSNIQEVRRQLAREILGGTSGEEEPNRWVKLVSYTPDMDIEILTASLFMGSDSTYHHIRATVEAMTPEERAAALKRLLDERKFGKDEPNRETDRFRRVPREFEHGDLTFDMFARGGDWRDLQRHRMLTQHWQKVGVKWGYDLEPEVLKSPFVNDFRVALEKAAGVVRELGKDSPDIAQYATPFAYLVHFVMKMTARELHWMGELRTGPQGRPHYREIVQQAVEQATEVAPAVFQGLMVDKGRYLLARRESEIRKAQKIKKFEAEEK